MCTSTGLIVSPSTAGSVITGGAGVAEMAAAAPSHANAAAPKKARRRRNAAGRATRGALGKRSGIVFRSITRGDCMALEGLFGTRASAWSARGRVVVAAAAEAPDVGYEPESPRVTSSYF